MLSNYEFRKHANNLSYRIFGANKTDLRSSLIQFNKILSSFLANLFTYLWFRWKDFFFLCNWNQKRVLRQENQTDDKITENTQTNSIIRDICGKYFYSNLKPFFAFLVWPIFIIFWGIEYSSFKIIFFFSIYCCFLSFQDNTRDDNFLIIHLETTIRKKGGLKKGDK